jgi:hypothetical protein
MNAAVASGLELEGLTASGGRLPEPPGASGGARRACGGPSSSPRGRSRSCSARSAATRWPTRRQAARRRITAAIVRLRTSTPAFERSDPAVAPQHGSLPAGPGAKRRSRGEPDAKKGRHGKPGAKKGHNGKPGPKNGRHGKPGAKKGHNGKPGPKKGHTGKSGGKKRGHGRRRGDPGARDHRQWLFYTANVRGTVRYENIISSAGITETGGASLRASSGTVQLTPGIFADAKRTPRYWYGFRLTAYGELTNYWSRYAWEARGNCSARTISMTEPGPAPTVVQTEGSLRLPVPSGRSASTLVKRLGPGSATLTDSGLTCTRPDGTTYTALSPKSTAASARSYHEVCPREPVGRLQVASVATGEVAWGKPFTISVTCTVSWVLGGSSHRDETSLTVALTPCPGRATKPC